ncbi:carboxypeptidase-like regulatory domain-containing protein [Spongiimicrobium salis]|uniref:carboxypeptidase-like regulatory domain-containing protein n=1 Tax=Spongiimicrobium salis TaxID=1667022 RepID=UPI00374D2782
MGRLWFFFVLIGTCVQAQVNVTGLVVDALSQEPLEGVSVFYDGTTIGTITDQEGKFTIRSTKTLTTPLVISFIGFESQTFLISNSGDLGTVLLKEKAVALDEVVLEPDTWSREKKLNIFRREFLGKTAAALQCKIRNEKDIRLYFNKEEKVLYAYAKAPIRIRNNYLGYDIAYELHDFEVHFSIGSGLEYVLSSYNAGTVLFSEKKEKVRRRYQKNREKTYLGSVLHFMRALSKKELEEEKFKVFKGRTQIGYYDAFALESVKDLTKVVQGEDELSLLYNNRQQSLIKVVNSTFFIDQYGNHTPVQNVFFGGEMGRLRVGDMLPLNYAID